MIERHQLLLGPGANSGRVSYRPAAGQVSAQNVLVSPAGAQRPDQQLSSFCLPPLQPAELADGPFTIATQHRNPPGFGRLLSAMGFQPSTKERQRAHGRGIAEGEGWDGGSWERQPAYR